VSVKIEIQPSVVATQSVVVSAATALNDGMMTATQAAQITALSVDSCRLADPDDPEKLDDAYNAGDDFHINAAADAALLQRLIDDGKV
jgi:hypothetical protein